MSERRICDYEDSSYRTDFWEGQGRQYEDRVERIAIRRLMPLGGKRLLQGGAGYGRLTPMFKRYEQAVLLDFSRSQLEFARERHGDQGLLYVAADIYKLPFAPGIFDGITLIRVLHHLEDPPAALQGLRNVMQRGGIFLLEFANKQNLKAIGRWLLCRQTWNPFDPEPVEFAELHYDFHPRYIREKLTGAGFLPGRTLTVSHFRLDVLKRFIPTQILVTLDSIAQLTGDLWQLSPSVFVRCEATGADEVAPEGAFWRCPACGGFDLVEEEDHVYCQGCRARWGIVNGVYNFKKPLGT